MSGRRHVARQRYETDKGAQRFAEPRVLLGSVGSADRHIALGVLPAVTALHPHEPRVTADLAVLHEAAMDVRLDEDLDLFAAVGAGNEEVVGIKAHGSALRGSGQIIKILLEGFA